MITENPYRPARDIPGIRFCTADQIAAKLGIAEAMIRTRAELSFGLAEATGQGHCRLPVTELIRSTALLAVGDYQDIASGIHGLSPRRSVHAAPSSDQAATTARTP